MDSAILRHVFAGLRRRILLLWAPKSAVHLLANHLVYVAVQAVQASLVTEYRNEPRRDNTMASGIARMGRQMKRGQVTWVRRSLLLPILELYELLPSLDILSTQPLGDNNPYYI